MELFEYTANVELSVYKKQITEDFSTLKHFVFEAQKP